ncbi:MAG: hypothetical protein KIT02_15230 [Devosia sp.]|uniref:DUF7662 domain-containing protein n=1 Tax=Devosia sp. TaxID=1871048 RepID=UPI0024C6A57B|nr:hypothetical protein [Devosia sp.]UYN99252.1 MAG: hypothetical protein KIT02_15230 [Devosia sp.]
MAKYDKFREFLENANGRRLRLSFADIEKIIGQALPASKQYPAWWSNNTDNSVMTKAWREAGYKSAEVDVAGEAVSFVREENRRPEAAQPATTSSRIARSPLLGSMKGTTFVAVGVDLTQPADPSWGKVYDNDFVPFGTQEIVDDTTLSVADKIRELDGKGVSRAQIARLLGKRYQHVRNVLERDLKKAG